jgi:hypothetical protein
MFGAKSRTENSKWRIFAEKQPKTGIDVNEKA